MGESYIVRRGGGTGKLFAIISVTYPAGSACTCTNGTKTLKARDTSGKALFNVEAGTYTIECHTSDNSKSKNVSVTVAAENKGMSIPVTLTYELVLYDYGTKYPDITGSWSRTATINEDDNASGGSFSEASNHLSFYSGYHRQGVLSHSKAIDVTNYTILKVTYAFSDDASGYTFKIGIGKLNDNTSFVASIGSKPSSITTYNIDISDVTGNVYFKAYTSRQQTVNIYKIQLE